MTRTVARLRGSLRRGGRALDRPRRRDASEMVGAAQSGAPAGGATEVVGVVVAPSHRRRGLAAAMVASLARQGLDAGLATVFLEAAPRRRRRLPKRGVPADIDQRAHIVGGVTPTPEPVPTPERRWPPPALRVRPFRWYWAAQWPTLLGTWMQVVALGFLVYQQTGAPPRSPRWPPRTASHR